MPRQASTTARGYGSTHQAERKRWAPSVAAGLVNCWRCGRRILPGAPWDLGHDDHDRTAYRGPEHRRCNRSAGAALGNRRRGTRRRTGASAAPTLTPTSARW